LLFERRILSAAFSFVNNISKKTVDFVHRLGVKECWASPKGVSLSAESDKGVTLDLQAFEKA